MKIFFLPLLLSLFGFVGSAQNNTQRKVKASTVTFKIKNAGLTVNGTLTGFSANIIFDADKGFGNKIDASVDANTINTGSTSRDNHIKKEDYFWVEKFPKISMKGTVFSKEPDGKFKGFFTITIKGISNSVPIIFNFIETGAAAKMQATFKINRLDYKIGESSWVLSDDVNISIMVELDK